MTGAGAKQEAEAVGAGAEVETEKEAAAETGAGVVAGVLRAEQLPALLPVIRTSARSTVQGVRASPRCEG